MYFCFSIKDLLKQAKNTRTPVVMHWERGRGERAAKLSTRENHPDC